VKIRRKKINLELSKICSDRKTMKNKNLNIESEIQKTMDLLDDFPKIQARYGFYDRLSYHLEKKESEAATVQAKPIWNVLRHAITPAVVSAGIFIGVFFGLEEQATTVDANLETLIETYGLSVPSVPNYFNAETN